MSRFGQPATVGDLMAVDPILIHANASLTEAAALLDKHHIHGLPVVDGAGALVGVLSQTDLVRARSTEYLWANWPGLAVRHLMTSPAITITRSTPVPEAAAKMEKHHIHRLVVVADDDERLPIGVLSTTDLVHAIAWATGPSRDQMEQGAEREDAIPSGVAADVEEAPDAR
jgi:CBS domain-containing protein